MKKNALISKEVNKLLSKQKKIDTLRFITCGSVDDGKSTLIGRMLYDSKIIFEDQLDSLKNETTKYSAEMQIDFSLLLDGLVAEREQKITIDVAYRYFQTPKRRFIVADCPGHIQYTRNMVTAASTAKLAIILVNAKKGILSQTLRHSFICSLLGVKNIILAINKMDLIGYEEKKFETILKNYIAKTKNLNFSNIAPIPISAKFGDNIIRKTKNLDWFKGKTLLKELECIKYSNAKPKDFLFSVQMTNTYRNNSRYYAGIVREGIIKVNDKIKTFPGGQSSIIKKIVLHNENLKKASKGLSVSVLLKNEIDVSRGDIITSEKNNIESSDLFKAKIIWLNSSPGYVGRLYYIKIGFLNLDLQITKIKKVISSADTKSTSETSLVLNDICEVEININKKIPFKSYSDSRSLGSFIIIDRLSFETLGAGMIDFPLRRSLNIISKKGKITKKSRNTLFGHSNKILWFTGLSGSGKSTIANYLEKKLHSDGIKTFVLDGDNIRKGLNKDLGFKTEDRIENIRRIAEVSKIMFDAGLVVLVAFISPFKAERYMARSLFKKGDFLEIFVNASLETVKKRDTKGLYRKAKTGKLLNFTGISSPYEKPENPEIILNTDQQKVESTVDYLYNKLDFKLK